MPSEIFTLGRPFLCRQGGELIVIPVQAYDYPIHFGDGSRTLVPRSDPRSA